MNGSNQMFCYSTSTTLGETDADQSQFAILLKMFTRKHFSYLAFHKLTVMSYC